MVHRAHLNKRPSYFHDVQCSLNGRFCPAGVNGDIYSVNSAPFLKTKLFHHRFSATLRIFHLALIRVVSGWEENVGGCVVFCELESRGYNINRDHSSCTEGFCDCHAKETHGTSPPYGDGLGSAEVGDVGDCMDCDGKGLNLHPESAGGRVTGGD